MQIAEMDEGPTQDLPAKDASHPEIIKKYTAFFNEREKKKAAGKDYFKVPYPWGEGRKEVKERCKVFLKDEISKANHDGIKALVIVSHASICHALQAYACGHDKTWFNDHTPLTYGGITILEGDKLKEFKELPAEELKEAFPGHHIRGHYKKDNFPIGR